MKQTGGAEDLAATQAIQRGLASGANEVFTFGRGWSASGNEMLRQGSFAIYPLTDSAGRRLPTR